MESGHDLGLEAIPQRPGWQRDEPVGEHRLPLGDAARGDVAEGPHRARLIEPRTDVGGVGLAFGLRDGAWGRVAGHTLKVS